MDYYEFYRKANQVRWLDSTEVQMNNKNLKGNILFGCYIGLGVSSVVFMGGPVRRQLENILTVKGDRVDLYIQDVIRAVYMTMFMVILFFILGLYLIVTKGAQEEHKRIDKT
ncbi:MAG: hypothetical protein ACI9X4_002606 [Glaciecola sp.]